MLRDLNSNKRLSNEILPKPERKKLPPVHERLLPAFKMNISPSAKLWEKP